METFHSPIPIINPYAAFNPTNSVTSCIIIPNNNTFSSASSFNPWMDNRIWSRLPKRLVDRVIAFLPPPAFFKARAVCKRWYGLLFSPTFLELYLQVSPQSHWFIFFKQQTLKTNNIYKPTTTSNTPQNSANNATKETPHEGFLFDPYTLTWYPITFPIIPPGLSPVSSSGGLISFISDDSGSKTLLLFNPLIGSLTPLPATLRPRLFPSVGMNITSSTIDLIVAGDDLISPYAVKNLTTESFHIDAGGFYSIWGTASNLPRLCSLESGKMIYVAGKFYCMNYSPFSVLCYDVVSNNWSKIQAPMRRFLRSPSLVESRGKLVLVASVEKSKLNVPKSCRIWILQECGSSWVEIERMPQQLYVQFEEIENGNGFECVGHGEFVMILIGGRNSDNNKALMMFDFGKKRWLWVPPCPYVCPGMNVQLHGFAYQPRLTTPVITLLDQLTLPFQPF
ncbi:hypothetical protein LIER_15010 [Lithospermum erythrorhizon]|uniref:F-box domain-containing protein n=1 Tax=Lithospermum erythrorhizon TaxID=34254 RepID=A0AAV3Q1A6_LITER